MITYLLFDLFLLLVDVILIVSILSLFSLSLYYWLYERDYIEYEEGNKS